MNNILCLANCSLEYCNQIGRKSKLEVCTLIKQETKWQVDTFNNSQQEQIKRRNFFLLQEFINKNIMNTLANLGREYMHFYYLKYFLICVPNQLFRKLKSLSLE